MEDYTFERLSPERVKDVHGLFLVSSKLNRSLNDFKKKYDTKYMGISYLGYIAYDKFKKPAAFYCIIPTTALINNTSVLIAQATDAITHPSHQHKGLFTKLILLTNELAKINGIHFIFGVPNQSSFSVYKKLSWPQNGIIYRYILTVPMIPFAQLFRKSTILRDIYQKWVRILLLFFKEGTLDINNSNTDTEHFGIKRDSLYTEYKRFSNNYLIRLSGKSVWLKFEGTLKIGEVEELTQKELKSIIRRIRLLAFFSGIHKIQYQCSSKSAQRNIFREIFKEEPGLPIVYLNLSGKYSPENLVLSLADLDTF